jgi:sugar-specific transcriptional regulator TrmB
MVVNSVINRLMEVGFSEYEGKAYVALLGAHPATAYEIARESGIPTSKVYEVLARLREKGVVMASGDDQKKRYVPLDPDEFIEGRRSGLEATLAKLKKGLAAAKNRREVSYIWNIHEQGQLMDKAARMIEGATESVLLSVWREEMGELASMLEMCVTRGIRVAVVHFGRVDKSAGCVFQHPIEDTIYNEKGGRGLTVVADGKAALMGTVFGDGSAEGAWSENRGFVTLAEDYIKHDIYIMKIVNRFDTALIKKFGKGYGLLRDIFSDREAGR